VPEETTPDLGNSVIRDLIAEMQEQAGWPSATAPWHPTNEATPEQVAAAAAAAQQIDWESPDNPYVKRFQDTQGAYTQNQQRLRELEALETDRDAWMALGAKHGIEFEIPDAAAAAAAQGIDPAVAAMQAELAETRAWRAEVQSEREAERRAAGMELFHGDLDAWAKADGVELDQADHAAVYGVLMQAADPTQESNARAAYEAHVKHIQARDEARRAAWEEERRRPRVPTAPASGDPATGVPKWDEMSPEDQDRYMADRMRGAA
jgi:hypothetical protein